MTSAMTEILARNVISNFFNIDRRKKGKSKLQCATEKAIKVAHHILTIFVYEKESDQSSLHHRKDRVCDTLEWVVQELLDDTHDRTSSFMKQIKLVEGQEDVIINRILDSTFSDNRVNWGRVGAAYALGVKMAAAYRDKGIKNREEVIMMSVATYIINRLGNWILEQGGWDNVYCVYSDHEETIRTLRSSGVLLLTLGVGALISTMVQG